jgi:arylsulfatase A-like enzyme
VLACTLALGLVWYAVELLLAVRSGAGAAPGEILGDWLRMLPWQLALFALLGAGIAIAARLLALDATGVGWFAIGAATTALLGARVLEGGLRTTTPASAAGGFVVFAVAVAILLGALAAVGRVLPPRRRAAWPLAVWAAWTALVVPFARSAGASIALGELPLREWPSFVSLASLVGAALAAAAVLVLRSRRGATGVAACTAILAALAVPTRAAEPARPDVIVVLLDTLRDDHVGPRPDAATLTPNLDAIAAEGLRFRSAWSPANVTRRAMPGILASSTERVVGTPLAAEARTLAEHLRDAGFATAGLSANPFVSRHTGYDRGFDHFSDPSDAASFLVAPLVQLLLNADGGLAHRLGLASGSLYYEPAQRLFARGVRLLGELPRPAFLYLHAMDVHGPYLPPRRLLPAGYDASAYVPYSRFLRLPRETLLDPASEPILANARERYAAGVRHTDEAIGRLREALAAQGRWDESLVWILSDHGEAFGEQGFVGHGTASLQPVLIRVPLIVKPPLSWSVAPREVDAPVSTWDLMPTILGLLGLPIPADAFGADLASVVRGAAEPPVRDLVAWSPWQQADHYAVVRESALLEVEIAADGTRTRRLFDLAADADAQSDVASQREALAAALEAAVDRHRALEQERALAGTAATPLDPAARERLEALGYIDAEAGP